MKRSLAEARGQRERNERQSLRLNYTLLPAPPLFISPRFLNLSPRNRCFQQPSRPPLSFPIQAWNTRCTRVQLPIIDSCVCLSETHFGIFYFTYELLS